MSVPKTDPLLTDAALEALEQELSAPIWIDDAPLYERVVATLRALRQRLTEVKGERDRLRNTHEPGCPAVADDESDQVLYDYGVCSCLALRVTALEAQLAEAQEVTLQWAKEQDFHLRGCAIWCRCGGLSHNHDECDCIEELTEQVGALLTPDGGGSMNPEPSDLHAGCNHHHELTDEHEVVDFGDGAFVANTRAIPLLKALNEIGLRTRTHHIAGDGHAFVSILLGNGVTAEVREVQEGHSQRTRYNGRIELLLTWVPPSSSPTEE